MRKGKQQRRKFGRVLGGEDLGRRHQRRLHAVARREHDRSGSDERFSAADVALQHSIHRDVARHVVPNFGNRTRAERRSVVNGRAALEFLEQSRGNAQRLGIAVALALGAPQLRRGRERQKLARI